ncbi:MAG: MBL fold metallo-hydrolase [Desulfurococcales archaeon]|nr:MBL fold metallo-hydrolase [Desulfurococcales archaeon]
MPILNYKDLIWTVDVTPKYDDLIGSYVVAGSEHVAVVDPGTRNGLPKLLSWLDDRGFKPSYIVVTHIHLDHGGGACELAKRYNAKVFVHPRGGKHLINPSKLWTASKTVLGVVAEEYGEPSPCREEDVVLTNDGETLELGGLTLKFVHTPGHASHHQSIFVPEEGVLFSGDSAGVILEDKQGVPRIIPTTPPPFKPDAYLESLEKMARLNPQVIGPTHYGLYSDAAALLRRHMKQTRIWVDTALEYVNSGRDDIKGFIKLMAEREEDARFYASSFNEIVKMSFVYATVMGMLDYAKRVLSGS